VTTKDLQDLIFLSHSIRAMRKQFIENFDALAARVEILLPEDSTPVQKQTTAEILAMSNKMISFTRPPRRVK